MKSLLISLMSGIAMSSVAWASAPITSITSFNDLPHEWTGVAGDLTSEQPATLTINSATETAREQDPNGGYTLVTYTTDAALTVASRNIQITGAQLQLMGNGTAVEISFQTNDVLYPTFFVSVVEDATGLFSMRELAHPDHSLFVLTGKN